MDKLNLYTIGFFIFFVLTTNKTFGKPGPEESFEKINKVSPFEKEALTREIYTVLNSASMAAKHSSAQECQLSTPRLTNSSLFVDVNGKTFFILLAESDIGGITYSPSLCHTKTIEELTEVACITRSKRSSTNFLNNDDQQYSFIMKYNSSGVYMCPTGRSL